MSAPEVKRHIPGQRPSCFIGMKGIRAFSPDMDWEFMYKPRLISVGSYVILTTPDDIKKDYTLDKAEQENNICNLKHNIDDEGVLGKYKDGIVGIVKDMEYHEDNYSEITLAIIERADGKVFGSERNNKYPLHLLLLVVEKDL
jgi:hypothetical protein